MSAAVTLPTVAPPAWKPLFELSKEGKGYRVDLSFASLDRESGVPVYCFKIARWSTPTGKKSEVPREKYRWWNSVTLNLEETKWMLDALEIDCLPSSFTIKNEDDTEQRSIAAEWKESKWGRGYLQLIGSRRDKKDTKVFIPKEVKQMLISGLKKALKQCESL